MIIIVKESKTIAKFESWEGNKAMDWITQQGLFRTDKVYLDNNVLWMCKPL